MHAEGNRQIADYALPVDRRSLRLSATEQSVMAPSRTRQDRVDPQTLLLSANRIQEASQKMPNEPVQDLTIPLNLPFPLDALSRAPVSCQETQDLKTLGHGRGGAQRNINDPHEIP